MPSLAHFISKIFWLLIVLSFSVIIAIVVGSNTQKVVVTFWPIAGQVSVALWGVILFAFVVGLILGSVIIWLKSLSSYFAANQMKKLHRKNNLNNLKHNAASETLASAESYLLFDKEETPSEHKANTSSLHASSEHR